ncbi:prostatic acid phosphatase [Aethina tumida]|uniref:prostatic acid phosphatase n=1 Tax=Aethina tumida TaxID=116153 RepID=UPI00096AF7AC|nr:prostatic acid phosphatase [Aethina tumida]
MRFTIFVSTCLFACFDCQELVSVAVIYRHGDRTPLSFYENDPYSNLTYWPEGVGQLTNEGKLRQYNLGKWLRNRYSNLLPESYNHEDILVKSDDIDRTIMSALANLAGLYPPDEEQKWSELNWMPIPIHNRPNVEDSVIAMEKPCDKYERLFEELMESEHFKQVDREYKKIYEYLTENSGTKTKTLKAAKALYTTLSIEEQRNLTLPDWTKHVYPDKLKAMASLSFQSYVYTDPLTRLRVGPFYHELIGNFNNTIESLTNVKLWMFSGHDKNVIAVLAGLGALEPHIPQFASTVIFELKRNNGEYYVEVYYKHGDELERIQVEGCDLECRFNDFIQVVEEFTVDPLTWDKECEN